MLDEETRIALDRYEEAIRRAYGWDAKKHVADAIRRGVDPVSSYIDIQLNQLAWDEQHCAVLPKMRGRFERDLEAIRDEQERQKLARKPRLVWSRD